MFTPICSHLSLRHISILLFTNRIADGCIQRRFSFPFQRLPGELRQEIYEVIIDDFRWNYWEYEGPNFLMTHPFLRLNSLIRSEFLPAIYTRLLDLAIETHRKVCLFQLHPELCQSQLRTFTFVSKLCGSVSNLDSDFSWLALCKNLKEVIVQYDLKRLVDDDRVDWDSPEFPEHLRLSRITKLRSLERIVFVHSNSECWKPVVADYTFHSRLSQIARWLKACLLITKERTDKPQEWMRTRKWNWH